MLSRQRLLATTAHLAVRFDGESAPLDRGRRRHRGLVGNPRGFHIRLRKHLRHDDAAYAAVERLKHIRTSN